MSDSNNASELSFYKWEGLGNDFVMVLGRPDDNSADLARTVCRRRTGVGADGLIYLFADDDKRLHMEIFNADGSVAAMCGNGIRCLAALAVKQGMLKAGDTVEVYTRSGPRTVCVQSVPGADGGSYEVRVGMGIPVIGERIFVTVTVPGSAYGKEGGTVILPCPALKVDMGNPHFVVLLPEQNCGKLLEAVNIAADGPRLEELAGGANVEFVYRIDEGRARMRVWERGVGETAACGTGSCAVFAALHKMGLAADQADIELPGGTLHIGLEDGGSLAMTGPASEVFAAVLKR